jgi:hypothetical protein
VLKTQYNLAWNYFNSHELGNVIFDYWREWLTRADSGNFNHEFPAPTKPLADGQWDLRETNILNAQVILSRKRTRNFLDLANLWKRTVITGIEGQAIDQNLALMRNDLIADRPFIPDVNTQVVGRGTQSRMDDQDDDMEHLPVRLRYPSPTPGTSSWHSASMTTWGQGRQQ